jgi:hypothetical protein
MLRRGEGSGFEMGLKCSGWDYLISKTNEPRTIKCSSHRSGVVYPFRPTKNISKMKVDPSLLLCSEYCKNMTDLHLNIEHSRLD